jgi:hypothetical protein
VTLAQVTGAQYTQRWVQNHYFNPIHFGPYFYTMALDGGASN